jgi:hypothetical protein
MPGATLWPTRNLGRRRLSWRHRTRNVRSSSRVFCLLALLAREVVLACTNKGSGLHQSIDQCWDKDRYIHTHLQVHGT